MLVGNRELAWAYAVNKLGVARRAGLDWTTLVAMPEMLELHGALCRHIEDPDRTRLQIDETVQDTPAHARNKAVGKIVILVPR